MAKKHKKPAPNKKSSKKKKAESGVKSDFLDYVNDREKKTKKRKTRKAKM